MRAIQKHETLFNRLQHTQYHKNKILSNIKHNNQFKITPHALLNPEKEHQSNNFKGIITYIKNTKKIHYNIYI